MTKKKEKNYLERIRKKQLQIEHLDLDTSRNWVCEKCGCILAPEDITFDYKHVNCGGKCV
jgi:rubrerythrin